jgi:hypothetical protein
MRIETAGVLKPKKYRFDIKRMMADCEANYARLCQLLPTEDMQLNTSVVYSIGGTTMGGGMVSRSSAITAAKPIEQTGSASTRLVLTVTEQHRFSTCVQIDIDQPDLHLDIGSMGRVQFLAMIYHDVRMAEVISCNQRRAKLASYPFLNEVMFLPDEKAQHNRFLAEWLSLCLKQGLSESLPFQSGKEELALSKHQVAEL